MPKLYPIIVITCGNPTPKLDPSNPYFVVVDFEATRDELVAGEKVHMNPIPEIIEWLCYLVHDKYILSSYPYLNDISEFCTALTGITQELLRVEGCDLDTALNGFIDWFNTVCKQFDISTSNFKVTTFGKWDLEKLLPR